MSAKPIKYQEHFKGYISENLSLDNPEGNYVSFFKKRRGEDLECFRLESRGDQGQYHLKTGYFIGVDWIETNKSSLYVYPKLNHKEEAIEVDFVKMLFSSLKHQDVSQEIDELFAVKWESPHINLEQRQDLLTPFLVIEFLGLLKRMVKKGLKKSYYKTENNLHSKVKGKILVGKTIKQNLVQNKQLYTYCSYDEFGLNNKENRLLKKALLFVKRYLPQYPNFRSQEELQNIFNYINPTFSKISSDIELNEIKQSKTNAFYKEYEQALKLARLILKRFGYNISNTTEALTKTPPFWIDMSRLFELYVLGQLKDRFHNKVHFQFSTYGNSLDYLLNSDEYKMVIDAKYKPKYIDSNGKDHDDIRQVSGYARLNKVYDKLKIEGNELIDCLIIYPDIVNGHESFEIVDLKEKPIKEYRNVYKLGVRIPTIN